MSNKVISTDALIAKFRQALNEGWGYIWGTAGEKWTAAKQKELEKTTDGSYWSIPLNKQATWSFTRN